MTPLLPPNFSDLGRFVEAWAHVDFETRFAARYEADMENIQCFYDAIVPRMEEALAVLEAEPLDALEGQSLNLFRLVLAATHVALAVERHGQPRPASAHYPVNLRILNGTLPA